VLSETMRAWLLQVVDGLGSLFIAIVAATCSLLHHLQQSPLGLWTLLICGLVMAPFAIFATLAVVFGAFCCLPVVLVSAACSLVPTLWRSASSACYAAGCRASHSYGGNELMGAVVDFIQLHPYGFAALTTVGLALTPFIFAVLAFATFWYLLFSPITVPATLFLLWRGSDVADLGSGTESAVDADVTITDNTSAISDGAAHYASRGTSAVGDHDARDPTALVVDGLYNQLEQLTSPTPSEPASVASFDAVQRGLLELSARWPASPHSSHLDAAALGSWLSASGAAASPPGKALYNAAPREVTPQRQAHVAASVPTAATGHGAEKANRLQPRERRPRSARSAPSHRRDGRKTAAQSPRVLSRPNADVVES